MTERLRLEICMWFGPVNEETYVHMCAGARSLSIRKRSSDWDDPTGLELSPVGRNSGLGLNVCVTVKKILFNPHQRGG